MASLLSSATFFPAAAPNSMRNRVGSSSSSSSMVLKNLGFQSRILCPQAELKPSSTELASLSTNQKEPWHSSSKGLCDSVVGVLGGGQLGRMLCQAASPMRIKVAVLDPLADCPACAISYKHSVGSFRDATVVCNFAEGCGVLTAEIEHVDVEILDVLASEGVDVEPKPSTILTIQIGYFLWMSS